MADRVPTDEPSLDELDKFKAVLMGVLLTGEEVRIPCSDEREARLLRRRFYRLRDKLVAFEREAADGVAFSVVGRRVRCTIKPQVPVGMDWTKRIVIGASKDATESQRDISLGDRCNNEGGPGELPHKGVL